MLAPKTLNSIMENGIHQPVAIKVEHSSRKLGELLGRLQYFLRQNHTRYRPAAYGEKVGCYRAWQLNYLLTTDDKSGRKNHSGDHFKIWNYISSIEFYHKLHKDINKKVGDYAASTNKVHAAGYYR